MYYIYLMTTIGNIKLIFSNLSRYQQKQVLNELLQEHELQGKIIDQATEELKNQRRKKLCPHCESSKVYKRGKQNGVQMYQCRSETCGK